MQTYKEIYNDFYKHNSSSVHLDPVRFKAISDLCIGQILDIGCGTADLLDFTKNPYVGVDVSDVAINQAVKKFNTKGEFICADITKEKLELKEKVDTIVMAEFLEHIKESDFHIESILDYLVDDGRIIVSVPNGDRVPDKNHLQEFTIPKLRRMFSRYGAVKFYNWIGAEKRILMTCDIGKINKPNLSLCMILKNEEKGMEKCIMSAIEFVDDVVLFVDDTSTDKTLEIAKLFGDTVETFKWENDFSSARNLAQEKCKGEWVLILDGHEYVNKVYNLDYNKWRDYDGIWCRIKYEHGLSFAHPRIIRKDIKWKDAVHNQVLAKKIYKEVALKLIHDRDNLCDEKANKERAEQRNKMIGELMSERIEKNKKDTRALFYYAVHNQTHKKYNKAIKLYKKYLKYSKNPGERWYVTLNIAVSYMLLGKPRRAFWWAQTTENEISGRWENAHLCATILMHFRKFDRALPYLSEAMKDDKRVHMYYPIKRDIGEIWDMMGICFVGINQFNKAVVAFERAITHIKDQKKMKLIEAKVKAIQTICNLDKTKPLKLIKKNSR